MENEKKEEKKVEETKKEVSLETESKKNNFFEKIIKMKKKCFSDCIGKCKKDPFKTLSVILAIILIIAIGYYGLVFNKENLSSTEAKTKAESFIKNNLVQEGTKIEISDVVLESGMYKMKVIIGEGEEKQEVDAYLSKDGKKFIPSLMDISEIEAEIEMQKSQEEAEGSEISKSKKPRVDLYVMSFCPFGNKAENTLKPVYDLLKNKVDFDFHYIVSVSGDEIKSLHGEKEVLQNEREACVLKYHGKDKWLSYATYVNDNCGSDGSCSDEGLKSVGLVPSKIAACVSSEGAGLMKEDAQISKEANASGSPTMIINGTKTKAVYKYGDSESYKQAICSAFETTPVECEKVLASDTKTAEGGSCK